MHIAINATALKANRSGVGWFIFELLKHLSTGEGGYAYSVFLNKAFTETETLSKPFMHLHSSYLAMDRLYSRLLWENLSLPRIIRRLQPDLVHGTAFALPLADLKIPTVVTIYDLIHRILPEKQALPFRKYLDYIVPRSCEQATRVIAISETTKRDLVEIYGISPARISITYGGVAPHFSPTRDDAGWRAAQKKYGLPDEFALAVGDLEPRKNLITAIRACSELHRRSFSLPLVIAGKKTSETYFQELAREIGRLGLKGQIIFTGRLEDPELPVLYRAATLFIFPSLYEGFGLPAIESMACGTPVVASNAGSLPEVIGEAGIILSPHEPEAFAEAIFRIATNRSLREELVCKSLIQAAKFSWQNTAEQTMQAYEQARAEYEKKAR